MKSKHYRFRSLTSGDTVPVVAKVTVEVIVVLVESVEVAEVTVEVFILVVESFEVFEVTVDVIIVVVGFVKVLSVLPVVGE